MTLKIFISPDLSTGKFQATLDFSPLKDKQIARNTAHLCKESVA